MAEDFKQAVTSLTDRAATPFTIFCGWEDKGRVNAAEEKMDTVEKEFLAFPDIAADTINALLYQGQALTDAECLWPGPTETIYQGREQLRNQYEDLTKYELIDGRVRVMYLIANQTGVDSKMLLRKAGYTGGIYREQYEGKIQDTFPVIELVLYWGNKRWRSSRSIRRMFEKRRLSGEMWKYIDGVQLHVYEMRRLPEETRRLFQSDMRIVVDYLTEGENYRSHRKITHKAALIKMIKVLSGETDTDGVEEWLRKQGIREEDEISVCELFDQYERKGREEGKLEGIAAGRKAGIREGKREGRKAGLVEGIKRGEARRLVTDIENAMRFFQVTLEKACEGLGTTVGRYEEAKRIL